jgi:hypothetical protein
VKTVDVWNGHYGTFKVPADVPRLFRIDGWIDSRHKLSGYLNQYFYEMDYRMRDNLPIQSWSEWIGPGALWFWADDACPPTHSAV